MFRRIRKNVSKSNKRASASIASAIRNVNVIEPLESRQMMSAVPAADGVGASHHQLAQAISLGDFKLRSHATVTGSVGDGANDSIYAVNVTAPIDLNVKLGRLKQNDGVSLLFADG